jgi:hypothetical protein
MVEMLAEVKFNCGRIARLRPIVALFRGMKTDVIGRFPKLWTLTGYLLVGGALSSWRD